MTEKHSWQIEQIHERLRKIDKENGSRDEKIDTLESFKDSTVEKLNVIFEKIEDLSESGKWLKRTLVGAMVAGVVTILTTLATWFIQN